MIPKNIKCSIESTLDIKIREISPVGGGCIARTQLITTNTNQKYFLKHSAGTSFIPEANGLKEIKQSGTIKVPDVILAEDNFLLLEAIDHGEISSNFFKQFGIQLAQMHKCIGKNFGFYQDNFIGNNPQRNIPQIPSWPQFFYHNRLLFQLDLARTNGLATKALTQAIETIGAKIDDLLSKSIEPPTLLHGDLWSGNYMASRNNEAVLIDPAVYYGHREADLAMTKLFGGFPEEFYLSYNNEFPLSDGYNQREGLYKLYHMLNHLNLFGRSYYSSSLSLALQYSN